MRSVPNRATLMQRRFRTRCSSPSARSHAQAAGQTALFGGDERGDTLDHVMTPLREWTKRERLDGERESLGLYLDGPPVR